jgi:hypothetical protein
VDQDFTWALDSPGQTSHLPTLNDTATAARLLLDGATGTINPGVGKTVPTGNVIVLDDGADVTFEEGTIGFTADGDQEEESIVIDGDSTFTCAATTAPVRIGAIDDGPLFLTINSGWFDADSPGGGPGLTTNQSVRNLGGTFHVPVGTVVTIRPPLSWLWSYYQADNPAAETRLEGSTIVDAGVNGFGIAGGSLWIKPIVTDRGTQDTATIIGPMQVTGGFIQFDLIAVGSAAVGKLAVQGDVTWTGGQYNPGYDPTRDRVSNEWSATQTMTITSGAKLAGVKVGSGTPDGTWRYTVLYADGGITGAPTNITPGMNMIVPPSRPRASNWPRRRRATGSLSAASNEEIP